MSTSGQLGMLDLDKYTISGNVQRVQEDLSTLNIMNMRDMLHLPKFYQQSLAKSVSNVYSYDFFLGSHVIDKGLLS